MTRETVNIVENFLSLDSLSTKLKLVDVIFIYDILNNIIDCAVLLSEISFRIPCRLTRNLFIMPNSNTNSKKVDIIHFSQELLFWPKKSPLN